MCRTRIFFIAAFWLLTVGANTLAAPISLNPLVTGQYLNGDGANSQWAQVGADWRGSIYGNESWGTGLWGLADAQQILALPAQDPSLVNSYSGRVNTISFADVAFLDAWGSYWGSQQLVPFFSNDANQYQDNYAVRFSGYISILDPGSYNFGVLYDDGFSFNLFGDNALVSIAQDGVNPRDRLGFDQDLTLGAGLYGYELLGYERLEAGVVNLGWTQAGSDWSTVPQSHLFTAIPTAVPEPATWPLLVFGLAIAAVLRAYRRT